jgi:hypothetical protein
MVAKKEKTENSSELNKIVDIIYDRSVEWGEKWGLYPKGYGAKKSQVSEKAKELAKAIDNHNWGGHDSAVRECFEIAIGEELPSSKKTSKIIINFKPGTAVTILSDPRGRKLPVGEAVLVSNKSGECITYSGEVKLLSDESSLAFKLSNRNEIEALVEEFIKKEDSWFILLKSFLLMEKNERV